MPRNSESGHAVNVANFNSLITFVTGYGEAYNPSNNSIKLPALQETAAIAAETLVTVNTAISGYNAAVSAREIQFAPLSKLVTRVMNTLKASGVSEQVYEQVRAVARKIQGKRAGSVTEPDGGSEPKTISSSQMGFDNRTENFARLVQLLAGIPEYNPNEDDLKVSSLTTLNADLAALNTAVVNAEVQLSNTRITRNEILYTETTGLCDIALLAKNYVKAVFGSESPQYAQISKISFKKRA